jgi:hypothetical protein
MKAKSEDRIELIEEVDVHIITTAYMYCMLEMDIQQKKTGDPTE